MTFITPTDAAARALNATAPHGPLVMVNLLRFRETADYAATPDLAPVKPISGAEAYRRYATGILPLLTDSCGTVLHEGTASHWFIGLDNEQWHHMLIVRQANLQSFLAFATDPRAQSVHGHRTAALADSRLLPSVPIQERA